MEFIMLSEFKGVKQNRTDGFRRWFLDDYFDLIVWYNNSHDIEGFQLCYDKKYSENKYRKKIFED